MTDVCLVTVEVQEIKNMNNLLSIIMHNIRIVVDIVM